MAWWLLTSYTRISAVLAHGMLDWESNFHVVMISVPILTLSWRLQKLPLIYQWYMQPTKWTVDSKCISSSKQSATRIPGQVQKNNNNNNHRHCIYNSVHSLYSCMSVCLMWHKSCFWSNSTVFLPVKAIKCTKWFREMNRTCSRIMSHSSVTEKVCIGTFICICCIPGVFLWNW